MHETNQHQQEVPQAVQTVDRAPASRPSSRWLSKPFSILFQDLGLALRSRIIRYGLIALLAGGVGWNAAQAMQQAPEPAVAQAGEASVASELRLFPTSPVVERYLQAQASFNAAGMWEALSDDLKKASGATVEQVQAEMESAWLKGHQYHGATYVGGLPMSGGNSVYFYVVSVNTGEGISDVPYIYIVGKDGKIVDIQ